MAGRRPRPCPVLKGASLRQGAGLTDLELARKHLPQSTSCPKELLEAKCSCRDEQFHFLLPRCNYLLNEVVGDRMENNTESMLCYSGFAFLLLGNFSNY